MLIDDKTHKRAFDSEFIDVNKPNENEKINIHLGIDIYLKLKQKLKEHVIEAGDNDETYDPENILGILDEVGIYVLNYGNW